MELEEKKPPDETFFSNKKKKTTEARKFKMVGNLEGKIQEEKKPPDETVHIHSKKKAKKDKTKIEAELKKKKGGGQDLDRLDVLKA